MVQEAYGGSHWQLVQSQSSTHTQSAAQADRPLAMFQPKAQHKHIFNLSISQREGTQYAIVTIITTRNAPSNPNRPANALQQHPPTTYENKKCQHKNVNKYHGHNHRSPSIMSIENSVKTTLENNSINHPASTHRNKNNNSNTQINVVKQQINRNITKTYLATTN